MENAAETKNSVLYTPWGKLKRLQDKKLHKFITHHLYPFSPYYRKLFDDNKINPGDIKTVADLRRIPMTSKEDFLNPSDNESANRSLDFVLQPNEELIKKHLPKTESAKFLVHTILKGKKQFKKSLKKEYRPIFLTATTGTTNQPISFLYTKYDMENLMLYGERIVAVMGINGSQRGLNVFPYAPHLAFWQTVFTGFASNMFMLSTGGGKTLGTDGNLRSLTKVKPQFLIGVPGYVYHMVKTARERNLDLSFLESIALGASRVPKGFKQKIANLLSEMGASDVKIFGTYGFTESRCAWTECPTSIDVSSGYHTYPDKEIFEIIDPDTGEVKREGEDGELVYTGIDARGSCVLRYRTGDLIKGGIVYSPCPHCGKTVPRISSDIVRASNVKNIQFSKVKGTLINLNALEHVLDDKDVIDEWQIEIRKKNDDPYDVDEIILYLSLLKDINQDQFVKELEKKIFSIAEVSFNKIEFVDRSEMLRKIEVETAVKAKKIIDRRE